MSSGAFDVLVVGAGPAGAMAALRAADLGARTVLATCGAFGGMAGNDGPVPVRTLAHAARLMRETRQLGQYGVSVSAPVLDYQRLLERVREVVAETGRRSLLRSQLEAAGVTIREHLGRLRFLNPHTLATPAGEQIRSEKIILCLGGVSRKLPVPGFELTATHSDAWSLTSVPPSMLVIGSGATGAQVASVFNAFGARVQLFEAGERILKTEEPEVSAAIAAAFRSSGIKVRERFGRIAAFEQAPGGVRMTWISNGESHHAEAAVAIVAVGWTAETGDLNLAAAGIRTDARGFIATDASLRTSTGHVFAAGDVTGVRMLVPQAVRGGYVAATNAVTGSSLAVEHPVNPVGSFTDPEYAQVGLAEEQARARHDVEVVCVGFDEMTRAIIDGRTIGFCKLIVDASTRLILGCHLVGDRAVDTAQIAAVAIGAGMKVDQLAALPLSFPTYAGVLGRAAVTAAHRLNRTGVPSPLEPADVA